MSDEEIVDAAGLAAVAESIKRDLPGWWWSICFSSIGIQASVGPEPEGPDADLCDNLPEGVSSILHPPSTCAVALRNAATDAIIAKARLRGRMD